MAFELFSVTSVLTLLLLFIMSRLQLFHNRQTAKKPTHQDLEISSPDQSRLCKSLASALTTSVVFPQDDATFKQSMNSYWAQQEREVIPACVVQPRDAQQLSTAITVLKREHDKRLEANGENQNEGLFAVRSGGHSPVPGAASIKGGVVIDMSLICEVKPSEDGSSVTIGAGAKWKDVSTILDEKGLAVVGGRNSAVGVGGLTLGGSIIVASALTNSDLWRALKGGSNNFGIVTRFKARSFPSTKIWSGFLYMPAFQTTKVLSAFHNSVSRSTAHDESGAGPIACFSYIPQLGLQIISVNLVHTDPSKNEKKWPAWWKSSGFASLWRFWSTCKVRTLTSATEEMNMLNPPGRRQVFATTTVHNDAATLMGIHAVYTDAIASIRRVHVKGLVWTLVLQPLLPSWMRKGDANSIGLGIHDNSLPDETPLVIVNFTVNWHERRDDDFVKSTTRRAIEQMDAVAAANGTGHQYRCMNYCADWQRPFDSYGAENLRFLREVSRRYDPDKLFQKGCTGGFKLDS